MGRTLHNIIHAHPEQKHFKREAKILRLIEVLRMYSEFLRDVQSSGELTQGCGPLRLGVATTDDQQEILICNFKKSSNRPGTAASSNSFNTGQNTGRDDDLIGSIQIPCVHFVNYNTEWYFRVPNKTDGNLVLEVFPS